MGHMGLQSWEERHKSPRLTEMKLPSVLKEETKKCLTKAMLAVWDSSSQKSESMYALHSHVTLILCFIYLFQKSVTISEVSLRVELSLLQAEEDTALLRKGTCRALPCA